MLTLTFLFLPGIQWDNMYQSPKVAGMTFGGVCWMILFDSGLYFLCGWYLNSLIPGKISALYDKINLKNSLSNVCEYWIIICSLNKTRERELIGCVLKGAEHV